MTWYRLTHRIRIRYTKLKYGTSCCDLAGYSWFIAGKISKDLVRLKKNNIGYPFRMTEQEWDKVLDDMILGFKKIADDEITEDEYKKTMALFAEHLGDLWI